MIYTLVSAQYSTPDHTAAIAITQEAGAVLCAPDVLPEVWEQVKLIATNYTPPEQGE